MKTTTRGEEKGEEGEGRGGGGLYTPNIPSVVHTRTMQPGFTWSEPSSFHLCYGFIPRAHSNSVHLLPVTFFPPKKPPKQ